MYSESFSLGRLGKAFWKRSYSSTKDKLDFKSGDRMEDSFINKGISEGKTVREMVEFAKKLV